MSVAQSAPRVGLVEEWSPDDPRLPAACARARDALLDRGRRVGVLHTVALLPTGELAENISVQSPGGVFLVWQRSERRRRVSLTRTPTGRPRPFRPGADVTWTGVAILNAWRPGVAKMTITRALQIISGLERA